MRESLWNRLNHSWKTWKELGKEAHTKERKQNMESLWSKCKCIRNCRTKRNWKSTYSKWVVETLACSRRNFFEENIWNTREKQKLGWIDFKKENLCLSNRKEKTRVLNNFNEKKHTRKRKQRRSEKKVKKIQCLEKKKEFLDHRSSERKIWKRNHQSVVTISKIGGFWNWISLQKVPIPLPLLARAMTVVFQKNRHSEIRKFLKFFRRRLEKSIRSFSESQTSFLSLFRGCILSCCVF